MIIYFSHGHGRIGEVVNTPDCGSGMQGFDPLILPQMKITKLMLSFFVFFLIFLPKYIW